jgi:hypothetical protein
MGYAPFASASQEKNAKMQHICVTRCRTPKIASQTSFSIPTSHNVAEPRVSSGAKIGTFANLPPASPSVPYDFPKITIKSDNWRYGDPVLSGDEREEKSRGKNPRSALRILFSREREKRRSRQ